MTVVQDLRHALRSLRRSPAFTAVAVLTLALGIGANATIFSLVNGVLFKPPLGVTHPDRLVAIYTSDFSSGSYGASAYLDYQAVREDTSVFSSVSAYQPLTVALGLSDGAEMVLGQEVSGDFFRTLGTVPAAGRLIVPGDAQAPGAEAVAVISHTLWRRRFGGNADAVGRDILLNGHTFRVVGVAPAGFEGLLRGVATDVWVPVTMSAVLQPGSDDLSNMGSRAFMMAARLRPGVSLDRARERLRVVARARYERFPDFWRTIRGTPREFTALAESDARVPPQARGIALGAATLLLVAVALVLLIACANMANLLLARAAGRRREIAVRVSLGAGRAHLVRHLLAESFVLAVLGAGAGLLVTSWITGLVTSLELPGVPVTINLDFGLDGRVLAFTAAVALAATAAFGLLPALRASRPDLVSELKAEATTATRARWLGLRNGLVIAQVAVSLVLLVAAGLFLRSLGRASAADPGFATEGMAVMTFDLEASGMAQGQGRTFFDRLLQRVRGLPGVRSATLARSLPLAGCCNRRGTRIEGYAPRPGESTELNWNVVEPEYFRTLRIPLLRGRPFTEADRENTPPVVIVNEALARRYWPGQDPLGKHLFITGPDHPGAQVIGVARDGKYRTLGEDPLPFFYAPYAQQYTGAMTLVVSTARDPARLLSQLRAEVRALSPAVPIIHPATMRETMGLALLPQRLGALLLGALGALAALLAALGLYGVIAYSVAQRTREFGIRGALGADRGRLVRQVLGEGMALSGIGAAIGLLLAAGAARLLGSFLFGVSPFDPGAFVSVLALLAGIALGASYLPARRATRIDPMEALRHE